MDFIPNIPDPEKKQYSHIHYGILDNDTSIVGNICYLNPEESEIFIGYKWYNLETDEQEDPNEVYTGPVYVRVNDRLFSVTIKKF